MAQPDHVPPTVDPDNVPETLCIGRFNVAPGPGSLVTLTFTNVRIQPGPMIDKNTIVQEYVVRARIVTTIENVVALRDLLNNSIQATEPHAPGALAGYRLN